MHRFQRSIPFLLEHFLNQPLNKKTSWLGTSWFKQEHFLNYYYYYYYTFAMRNYY